MTLDEVEFSYQRYSKLHSDLERLKLESEQFNKDYKKQSFLKKSFSFSLNQRKTELDGVISDIQSTIIRDKPKLVKKFEQYFFFNNTNEDINHACHENYQSLLSSEKKIEVIKNQRSIIPRQYNYFSGKLEKPGIIRLLGDDHPHLNLQTTYTMECYKDYKGTILPSGIMIVEPRNPMQPQEFYHSMAEFGRWTHHPDIFHLEIENESLLIKADLNKGGDVGFRVEGFRIEFTSFDYDRFKSNGDQIDQAFAIFKKCYPLVYQ
jgi:hypothetical protein